VQNFLRYSGHRQTRKQTDKQWQKHNIIGGANNQPAASSPIHSH